MKLKYSKYSSVYKKKEYSEQISFEIKLKSTKHVTLNLLMILRSANILLVSFEQ